MAILNSNVMWWFLLNTGTTLANGYFRFMPSYLKPFPIPNISETTENMLVDLVDKILKNKKLDKLFDCSDLEKEINRIVYKLYNLSKEEILIIENQI
jgi:hypothetical protein